MTAPAPILRLLVVAVAMLWATACAPAILEVPAPEMLAVPASGPSVSLAYPVDVRPAAERRDGGYYDTTIPLPLVTYGDMNLRPGAMEAIDRANRIAFAAHGIPIVEDDADYAVRVFVLHHAGVRDISDAQWVSTLTGGIAGTVGKFLYPSFVIVDGHVRIEVRDRWDRVVAVRDVESLRVKRRAVAFTWGWLYLFRRNIVPELFTEAFVEVHADLGGGAASIVDQVRADEVATAGIAPTTPAQHALADDWRRADSFDLRDSERADRFALAKYGQTRFSLYTGHDTRKGDVIGHVGLPLDTFGYDVGVTDHLQAQLDLTVLGFYNGLEAGLRWQPLVLGPTRIGIQGSFGSNVVLLPENTFVPVVAGVNGAASVIASRRPEEITTFLQLGATLGHVTQEFEAFPELRRGTVRGVFVAPGLEVQLTPTTMLGLRLTAAAQLQEGRLLAVGPLGPVLLVPQVGLGLR